MIEAFKEGKINEAGEMLFENNPMFVICSLVCDHGKQCEGHCVRGGKGEPVHISSIEHYISDTCLDRMNIPCQSANGKKAAVIGMGNSAMDVARTALRKGVRNVTLYVKGIKSQASESEIAYTKLDGARLEFCMQPVEINEDGPVFQKMLYDSEGNRLGAEGEPVQIFAAGDVVLGARTVVEAAAYSKIVADAMDKYMQAKAD